MIPTLLYGVPEGCSFGSVVALEWLGQPYRLCRIHMPEETQTDLYTRIAPVGETPVLVTGDGRALTEGMAILNHIAAHGLEMGLGHRQGSPGFDELNRALAFLNTTLFSAYGPLWFSLEHAQDPQSQAVLKEFGETQVRAAHKKLEALLSGQEWLSGDRIGLADAYFAGVGRWNDFHKVFDWAEFPRVQAVYERVQQDPAVVFAHEIEAGREPAGAGGFKGHVGLAVVAQDMGLAVSEPA
jgi:glutathione S-transferase